jgi:RHS repeat-associated protein
MKKIHLLISSLGLLCQFAKAQPTISAAPSQDRNYIVTYTVKVAGIGNADNLVSKNVEEVQHVVDYFDGLGRQLQNVQTKASPSYQDIVTGTAYDGTGRAYKKYLPYATSSNNGSYKADAITSGVFNFYNPSGSSGTQLPNGVARIPTPVAETRFELSPLSRVAEQGAPGDVWQIGGGHTIRQFYEINSAHEVSRWDISGSGATINGFYASGTLFKTKTLDENGNEAIVYKDRQGKLILKKDQDGSGSYASTYYVYDDFDNLRFVIPAKVTVSSFDENSTEFKSLIFAYRYDERNRVVNKQVPGKGWESIVYNKLDQIVATQDAVQAVTNRYTFTKYDALGRVIMTGEITDSRSPESLQNDLKTQSHFSETRNNSLTEGYTSNSFPTSWNKLYTVNYYDDYSFPGNPYSSSATGVSNRTHSLLTASKVRNLETGAMLWTVNYYDKDGRIREKVDQNHLGGADRYVNDYYFTGELKQSTRTHSSSSVGSLAIVNEYKYDHAGRKKQTWQRTGSGNNILLSAFDYNEVGQLRQKKLHSEDGANFIEPITYSYNPRGWLAGISSSKMAESLYYESAPFSGVTPNYNGNITEAWYNTPNRGDRRFYYKYDEANRLKESRYYHGSTYSGELDEVISYDKVGNIENLSRGNSGLPFAHHGAFAYALGGNRLNSVARNGSTYRSYSYDVNGNVIADGALGFEYNELNLPNQVKQNGTTVISYQYTATGQKLKKNSGQTGVSDYVNGIHYVNNGSTIDFIQTGEGRYIFSNGTYQYNLTDHLGNVRVMIEKGTATSSVAVQENEYYAFGLNVNRSNTSPDNKYLYNGKELQSDYNLNQYDYGARFYDPVIGRFTTVDKLADFKDQIKDSPYAYVSNNPISRIDPDGNCWLCPLLPFLEGLTATEVAVGTGVAVTATALTMNSINRYVENNRSVAAQDNTRVDEPKPAPDRAGKDFTPKGKQEVIDANKAKNDGKTVCEGCKTETTKPEKSQSGVTPPKTDTQVDHIKPKAKGGSGTPDNGQVLCRDCNVKKGDKFPYTPPPPPSTPTPLIKP